VLADAAAAVVEWFARTQRALPWRGAFPRDPYCTLVSEVMLQQTQVDRVVPVFERFLTRFPSLEVLAHATTDDVVAAFSGLGYYRRARLLHATAQALHDRRGWPTTAEELAKLAGVGRYTAAALATFCFGGAEPPVDGNVARITARLTGAHLELGSTALANLAHATALQLYDAHPTPETCEALIELGATICTPTAPHCVFCPLREECAAASAGNALELPLPRRRRARAEHRWVALWATRSDGRVLLRRISDRELLGGLWLPPIVEISAATDPTAAVRALTEELGLGGSPVAVPAITHTITHRQITVLPFVLELLARVAEPDQHSSWQMPTGTELPTSTLLPKLAAACAPCHSNRAT
jgi:A/G-specific adenine glycosylase